MKAEVRERMPAWALMIAALFLGMAAEAGATTLERMSVGEMTRRAHLVVRAQCVANATAWDAGEIWTFTTFEVEETWKGEPAGRIRVRLLGGRAGEVTSTVAGVPRFRQGEEVVMFLERTGRGDYSVVSWMQGTFRIRRDARGGQETVTQDTAGFEVYDPATRRFAATGVRGESTARFKAEVVAASGADGRITR